MQKRDKQTLLPIIQAELTIHSGEWRAYSCLRNNGYKHETVNHRQYFTNPQVQARRSSNCGK